MSVVMRNSSLLKRGFANYRRSVWVNHRTKVSYRNFARILRPWVEAAFGQRLVMGFAAISECDEMEAIGNQPPKTILAS